LEQAIEDVDSAGGSAGRRPGWMEGQDVIGGESYSAGSVQLGGLIRSA
jgi:hypothetical protein